CDRSSSRNEYAPVAVPVPDTVSVYAPAANDSTGLPERLFASETVNDRLLTGVPPGPDSDQRRLALFVSASKETSAGAARVKLYRSCSDGTARLPLAVAPSARGCVASTTGWTLKE